MCSTFKMLDRLKKHIENMEAIDAKLLNDGLLNNRVLNERSESLNKLKKQHELLKKQKEAEALIILKKTK